MSKVDTVIIIIDKAPETCGVALFDKWELKMYKKHSKNILLSQGIAILENYFKQINRRYERFEDINKNQFKKIIKTPHYTKIYIFGHGKRNGLRFQNGDFLEYVELKDYPKKKFIGQYHCNAGKFIFSYKKSLADYIAKKGDVNHTYRYTFLNKWEFIKLCCWLKKSPDEAEPSDYHTIKIIHS